MIPDRWYAILDAREVPASRPVGVTRLGRKLVLWRDADGGVCCVNDRCAHRGAALSAGQRVDASVECPFHGFRYNAQGRCVHIPANGAATPVPKRFRVDSYPVREAHGFIWLYFGAPAEELAEPAFFDDIDEGFCYTTFQDHWTVHYSRAIENQLDVVHLPFVHHNTIGRGGRTVVEGPIVDWVDDEHLRFYVFNRDDDGAPPRPASELSKEDAAVHLDFIFPNLWQNHLGDKLRILAAFAPVDDENTVIYLRLYQKILRVPLLRELFHWVMTMVNKIILGQDKRVVLTQQPRKTALKMGENLIAGDAPIIAYRRKRHELLETRRADAP